METPSNLDPYAPCHCGSGKKYKFCCLKTDRKEGKPSAGAPPPEGHVCQPGEKGHGDLRSGRTSPGQTFRPPPGRTPGRNG